jgi:hypothetical protein
MSSLSEKVAEAPTEIDNESFVDDQKPSKGVHLGATGEYIYIDQPTSDRIVRKFDWNILTLMTIINLFSFIDRVNIGNARLLGLQKDLDLAVGYRFNIALMCLLISYCVVELPSNIVLKKIGGHIWIPFLVVMF